MARGARITHVESGGFSAQLLSTANKTGPIPSADTVIYFYSHFHFRLIRILSAGCHLMSYYKNGVNLPSILLHHSSFHFSSVIRPSFQVVVSILHLICPSFQVVQPWPFCPVLTSILILGWCVRAFSV